MADIYKVHHYNMTMREPLDEESIFSDESAMFLNPSEPEPGDSVRIRLRTAKDNVDQVYLHTVFSQRIPMEREYSRNGFDYYKAEIEMPEDGIQKRFGYYFEIRLGRLVCYYNKAGVRKEADPEFHFFCVPGFHTPEWAKGAVMYQIYTDRFYNGDPSNDVETGEYSYIQEHVRRIDDWNTPIRGMDVRNFYGGDLQGVIDKLPYLKSLGVEAVYLNPIFVSPSNHKYDIQDYDHVDPHIGVIRKQEDGLLAEGDQDNAHAARYISRVTGLENLEAGNELFADLVRRAHSMGIRVILDGVFNHCGSFNKWMDHEKIYDRNPEYPKGAYIAQDSPYHSYFNFTGGNWPFNEEYDGWWGFKTLPKLNYEGSDELLHEILRVAAKWVSPPYNADGWRLDVAADLGYSREFNHFFWQAFRNTVKKANPDAVILAENYGSSAEWLQGDEWDSVMNYDAFMEPVSWFLTGMEKHSDSFREDFYGNPDMFRNMMQNALSSFPRPSLLTAMNQLDNHDHSRFLTRTNHFVGRIEQHAPEDAERDTDPAVLREAVLMQMTWPGAPTLYYGDEAGLCGFTDPDNRRPYPWGRENRNLIAFYQAAIRMHNRYSVLRTGSLKILLLEPHVMAFARFNGKDALVTILNNRDETAALTVPVWQAGLPRDDRDLVLQQVISSSRDGYSETPLIHRAPYGQATVGMMPKSCVVLHYPRARSRKTDAKGASVLESRRRWRGLQEKRGKSKTASKGRPRKSLQTIRK